MFKKKYKKYFNKLTFQMQRCRLRLTALTLQNTRYHSINIRDKKKKPPKTAKDWHQGPKSRFKQLKKRGLFTQNTWLYISAGFIYTWTEQKPMSVSFKSFISILSRHQWHSSYMWNEKVCIGLHILQQCYIWTGAIITNVTPTLMTSVAIFGEVFGTCLYIFSLHTCQIKCPFQL